MAEHNLATTALLKKDWDHFTIETSTQAEIDEIEGPTEKLFRRYTKAEFLEEAFRREMIGYPVSNAHDILEDPHLEDRKFWQYFDGLRFPEAFAHFSEVPPPPFRPAPKLGEHNSQIYGEELGMTESEMARLREEGVI
jgi:crotonobetainyl-CoA:carnitine CoA-transferase CaiB-like acyl-CoA transferase